jgi:hypothetical protein
LNEAATTCILCAGVIGSGGVESIGFSVHSALCFVVWSTD